MLDQRRLRYMEKNILKVFGDILEVQQRHGLTSLGSFNKEPFLICLLQYGKWDFECFHNDHKRIEQLKELSRDCRMAGLETTDSHGEMDDGEWHHSGSGTVKSFKMTVKFPTSPAIKVLYGQKKT